jgi:hypothetical protein
MDDPRFVEPPPDWESWPPEVVIERPSNGERVTVGQSFQLVAVIASSNEFGDGPRYVVESDRDGILLEGSLAPFVDLEVEVSLASPGDHELTVTAVDAMGLEGQDSVDVDALPDPTAYELTLVEPAPGPELPNFPDVDSGAALQFLAEVATGLFAPADIWVTWTTDLSGELLHRAVLDPAATSGFEHSGLPLGEQRITALAINPDGEVASDSLVLEVHDPLRYDHDGDCACEAPTCTGSAEDGCAILEGEDCDDADETVNPAAGNCD